METNQFTSRRIRVFLSSTFQDMQPERDYLVKHTFPAIKAIAEKRHVDFSVVDLRWGVTEEEAREGKTIEICLNAIDDTRPYFIGLIGDRYGWCPEVKDIKNNKRLLTLYPWVEDCIREKLSITEMEVRYGAFLDASNILSHFYIKKSQNRSDESSEKKMRLSALRKMVENKAKEGVCGASHYTKPKQLGDEVYSDLLRLLNELYPESQNREENIVVERQNYILSQYQKVYFNFLALDELEEEVKVRRSKRWCMVLKNKRRGIGKTALVCNWRKNDANVIRTILNLNDNTSHSALLHFRQELSHRNLNASDVIWIIDGIDFLHTYYDRSLQWLLSPELHNTRIILTTYSDEMENKAKYFAQKDGRPCIIHDKINLQTYSGITKIAKKYLVQFAKKLTQNQYRRIQRDTKFSNIGILKIFLHELLQFGRDGEELNTFMRPYFAKGYQSGTDEFFEVVLRRLANDYGTEEVNTYFRLLSITEYGIKSEDMQRLLHMNALRWESFYESVRPLTISNGEQLYLHPNLTSLFKLKSEKFIDEHRLLIPLFERLCKQEENSKNADILNVELLQVELVLHYVKSGQEEKIFKKIGLPRLLKILRHNDEILYTLEKYIGQSGRQINKLLPRFVISEIGNAEIVAIYKHFLQSNIREIERVKKHISKYAAEESCKNDIIGRIDRLIANETKNIEEQWPSMQLSDINVYELLFFAQYEVVYMGQIERIIHIGEQADKLIKRYKHCQQTEDIKIALTALYVIQSYCCHKKQEYKQSNLYLDYAMQLNPTNEKFYIHRLLCCIDRKSTMASRDAALMINALHENSITKFDAIRHAANARMYPLFFLYRAEYGKSQMENYYFERSIEDTLDPSLAVAYISYALDSSMLYPIKLKTAILLDHEGYTHDATMMYLDSFNYARNDAERENSLQLAATQIALTHNEEDVIKYFRCASICYLMAFDKIKPIPNEQWHSSMTSKRLKYLIRNYDPAELTPYIIPQVEQIAQIKKNNKWRLNAIAVMLLHTYQTNDSISFNTYLKTAKKLLKDASIYENKEPLRAVLQCFKKMKLLK